MFSGYNTRDMVTLIETAEVFCGDLDAVDFDIYLYGVRFESNRTAINKNSALKIEAVAKGIKEYAS